MTIEALTHTLTAQYIARNGRRVSHDFQVTERAVNDPAARADAISAATYHGQNRDWRFVNHSFKKNA